MSNSPDFNIRDLSQTDIEAVLDIWLRASLRAHDFIAPDFWRSQLGAMRDCYLPAAQTRVFDEAGVVLGFCAIHEDRLAALFVSPERQGNGIGTRLLADAMSHHSTLVLSVYAQNRAAVGFYEAQGFVHVEDGKDPHTGHREFLMRWTREACRVTQAPTGSNGQ